MRIGLMASMLMVAIEGYCQDNIFQRIIRYFDESNKPQGVDGLDFSIIGGPHYASDTKLGIGLVAAGLYRHDKENLELPPCNVSLYSDFSTSGFFLVGIRGNDIGCRDRRRIEYDVNFYRFPTKFWGIGYAEANSDSHEVKYTQWWASAEARILWRMAPSQLFIGPTARFCFVQARSIEEDYRDRPSALILDQTPITRDYSLGVALRWDTRDNLTAPERGWLASLEGRWSPAWLGNDWVHSTALLTVAHYQRVWRGGVVASLLHADFNWGRLAWSQMASFGGSNTMRGYYEGRYRDKCEADLTVELRQRVWHRSGIAVWAGMATVAPRIGDMRWRKVLPNGGIGYRWEFKKYTNIRLDYGIGRGESSFLFSINEAF